MSRTPLPPGKRAEVEGLERAIREAIDAESIEPVENFATADDAHLSGANEFKIRDIAHRIASKAVERHLAGKKRERRLLGDLPALRVGPPGSTRTAGAPR